MPAAPMKRQSGKNTKSKSKSVHSQAKNKKSSLQTSATPNLSPPAHLLYNSNVDDNDTPVDTTAIHGTIVLTTMEDYCDLASLDGLSNSDSCDTTQAIRASTCEAALMYRRLANHNDELHNDKDETDSGNELASPTPAEKEPQSAVPMSWDDIEIDEVKSDHHPTSTQQGVEIVPCEEKYAKVEATDDNDSVPMGPMPPAAHNHYGYSHHQPQHYHHHYAPTYPHHSYQSYQSYGHPQHYYPQYPHYSQPYPESAYYHNMPTPPPFATHPTPAAMPSSSHLRSLPAATSTASKSATLHRAPITHTESMPDLSIELCPFCAARGSEGHLRAVAFRNYQTGKTTSCVQYRLHCSQCTGSWTP